MPANLVGSRAFTVSSPRWGRLPSSDVTCSFSVRASLSATKSSLAATLPAKPSSNQQDPFGVHVDADTPIPLRAVIAALFGAYVWLDRRSSRQKALEFA